jgi:hypothetical protein
MGIIKAPEVGRCLSLYRVFEAVPVMHQDSQELEERVVQGLPESMAMAGVHGWCPYGLVGFMRGKS